MLSKYELYIQKIENRITNKVKDLDKPLVSNHPFFSQTAKANPLKKFEKMEALLIHLEKYREETVRLIKANPEDRKYYEAHFSAVLEVLEKVEEKYTNSAPLEPYGFKLIAPASIPYATILSDTINAFSNLVSNLAMFGGVATAILCGFAATLLGAGLIPAYWFGPLWLSGLIGIGDLASIALTIFGFLGALPGFAVGYALGGILGALIGVLAYPLLYLYYDQTNSYLNNKAFNCELLSQAYFEAQQEITISNDEIYEPAEDSSKVSLGS